MLMVKTIIFTIIIVVILIIGWIMNVVKFINLDFKPPYKAEIIRGVGLTPLGGIIGYINIKDN